MGLAEPLCHGAEPLCHGAVRAFRLQLWPLRSPPSRRQGQEATAARTEQLAIAEGFFSFLSSFMLWPRKVFMPTTLRAAAWLQFLPPVMFFSLSEGFTEDTARMCSPSLRAPSGTAARREAGELHRGSRTFILVKNTSFPAHLETVTTASSLSRAPGRVNSANYTSRWSLCADRAPAGTSHPSGGAGPGLCAALQSLRAPPAPGPAFPLQCPTPFHHGLSTYFVILWVFLLQKRWSIKITKVGGFLVIFSSVSHTQLPEAI